MLRSSNFIETRCIINTNADIKFAVDIFVICDIDLLEGGEHVLF
jgi:hypothetical protein